MLGSIQDFFQQFLGDKTDADTPHSAHTLHLATATLLIELCKADQSIDVNETEKLANILSSHFNLDQEQLKTLMDLAREESRNATSLFEFTKLFNEHYTYEEKLTLIAHMWEVAYADGNIDRYEDNLIRKVADLLYVSHSDFIRSKLLIRDQLAPDSSD